VRSRAFSSLGGRLVAPRSCGRHVATLAGATARPCSSDSGPAAGTVARGSLPAARRFRRRSRTRSPSGGCTGRSGSATRGRGRRRRDQWTLRSLRGAAVCLCRDRSSASASGARVPAFAVQEPSATRRRIRSQGRVEWPPPVFQDERSIPVFGHRHYFGRHRVRAAPRHPEYRFVRVAVTPPQTIDGDARHQDVPTRPQDAPGRAIGAPGGLGGVQKRPLTADTFTMCL
jgi:hypothetical protein